MKVQIDKTTQSITIDTALPGDDKQIKTTHALSQIPVLIEVDRNKQGKILRVRCTEIMGEGIQVSTPGRTKL